jgi:hypothetical protein
VRRAHPPSHISLDGLAVTTHWSCPQAPGCTNERGDNFPETGGTQLHEDAHRYRGNGAGAMATLRTAALNLLRLAGFQSIRTGMQSVMHDITALLAMVMRRPQPNPC